MLLKEPNEKNNITSRVGDCSAVYLQYCVEEGTVFETYQLQDWC